MGKNIKLCNFCNKEINLDKEKYVLLGTYENKKVLSEPYFHFNCFYIWYNKKVQEKAQNQIQGATKRAIGMMKGIIGGNQLQEVEFDLDKETKIDLPDYSNDLKEVSAGLSNLFKGDKKDGKRKNKMPKM